VYIVEICNATLSITLQATYGTYEGKQFVGVASSPSKIVSERLNICWFGSRHRNGWKKK
jgi:hypothetical protein